MAAQILLHWSRLDVWEHLLAFVQKHGVPLGMTFLDGRSVRAHQMVAGAASKVATQRDGARLKCLAARVAAMAPRPA